MTIACVYVRMIASLLLLVRPLHEDCSGSSEILRLLIGSHGVACPPDLGIFVNQVDVSQDLVLNTERVVNLSCIQYAVITPEDLVWI